MKVCVIGTGHAGISAAAGLVERGLKPVILDVGETLDERTRVRRDALAHAKREHWERGHAPFPASLETAGDLPKKAVFGSGYIYADDRAYAPVEHQGTTAAPTLAKGGFSMAWGGAVLPARREDLSDWPDRVADALPAHYAPALKDMPMVAGADDLAEAFPLYAEHAQNFPPSPQGQRLLADLERAKARLNAGDDQVAFGRARLCIDAENCRECGLCLAGCPYGAIYTLDRALDDLKQAGQVEYRSGAYVTRIEETPKRARVNWLDQATNETQSALFDRVYVAAGALSTARLMLNSLNAYDQPVALKDSAKFALPVLRAPGAAFAWPDTNTLADLFVEARLRGVSPHWLHMQMSPLNELLLERLKMGHGLELNGLGKLARPILSRLMVAWCGAHSNLSSSAEVRVTPGENDCARLSVRGDDARTTRTVKAYGRALLKMGAKFNTAFVPFGAVVSPTCSTGHSGGAFPMREAPDRPFETDTLGRLKGWKRTHLVDASTFPAIPGTTIALLIRANARRIVAECEF